MNNVKRARGGRSKRTAAPALQDRTTTAWDVMMQAMGGGPGQAGAAEVQQSPETENKETAALDVMRQAINGGGGAGGQRRQDARKKPRGRRAGPVRAAGSDDAPGGPQNGDKPLATAAAANRFAGVSTDIHRYGDIVRKTSERAESCGYDRDTVKGFLNMLSIRGLAPGRQVFYITRMWNILSMLEKAGVPRVSDATKADCEAVMADVLSRGYRGETNTAYALCLQRLVHYAKTGRLGSKKDDPYVPEVGWITPSSYRDKTGSSVQRKDLLTNDEFRSIVQQVTNLRDRALLWVLYEGAFRPGELLNMRVGGMRFADRYVMASTTGKTGEKGIALVYSFRPLLDWMEMHPHRDDPRAPLWFSISCKNGGGNLTYPGLSKIIDKAARAAGIKKRVWPYLFRHTQLTQLSKKLPDQLLRVYGNWNPGSKMAARYTHLSGEDAKKAILAMHGITSDDGDPADDDAGPPGQQQRQPPMPMQECPRCRASNEPDLKYCHGCGFILDDQMRSSLTMSDMRQSSARDMQHVTRNAFDRIDRLFNSMFADPGAHQDHGMRQSSTIRTPDAGDYSAAGQAGRGASNPRRRPRGQRPA